jgi:hypothetical protein
MSRETVRCRHVWRYTGNSIDGDAGRGSQTTCSECGVTEWGFSKGPNLGYLMRRAYNAYVGGGGELAVPPDESERWLALVKAVVETPQLIVTLQRGDTVDAYPEGVIKSAADKPAL